MTPLEAQLKLLNVPETLFSLINRTLLAKKRIQRSADDPDYHNVAIKAALNDAS